MRVLVQTGAQAGQVVEFPDQEARNMLASGAAVPDPEQRPSEPPAELPDGPDQAPEPEIAEVPEPAAAEPATAPKKKTRKTKRRG